MLEALQFEFMRSALFGGLMAGVLCGVMGTMAVANRMIFLAGGIAHAAYGGIGLALFLGLPFLPGTIGFAIMAALVMAAVSLRMKHRADAVIGVVWALGMAVGIIFTDLTPGYQVDLMSYLFGSILAVPRSDLIIMAITMAITIVLIWYFYPSLIALSFDEEFARTRGVPVQKLYFLLVVMLAVVVVLLIRIVGLILVIALLSIGPFIAERFCSSIAGMMVLSSILNICFTVVGLAIAYRFNLTAGACIILVAGVAFFIAFFLKPKRLKSSIEISSVEGGNNVSQM